MTMTLNGFGPLLALIPHQFGFFPQTSLVLVAMRGNQVCALVRLDEECVDVIGSDAEALLRDRISPAFSRFDADALVSVAYRCSPQLRGLESFNIWLERTFVPVGHSFAVAGDVWWTTLCRGGCCDEALHDLAEHDSETLAQAAGAVQNPTLSREGALATLKVHDPERARRVHRASNAKGCASLPQALRAWDRLLTGGRLSVEDVATVVANLRKPQARDRFLSLIAPELEDFPIFRGVFPVLHDPDYARHVADNAAENLLRYLAHVPKESRPHWLALLALSRWRNGDQCGAHLAADVALREGPSTPLATLVATALNSGMRYPDGAKG